MISMDWRTLTKEDLEKLLLEKDPNALLENGDSLMTAAVSAEREDLLKVLIEAGADINKRDGNDDYPITSALCTFEPDALVVFLLKHGANPNVSSTSKSGGFDGFTPLHYAVIWEHKESLMELLKYGADPEARESGGLTAAELADTEEFSNAEGVKESARIIDVFIENEDLKKSTSQSMRKIPRKRV